MAKRRAAKRAIAHVEGGDVFDFIDERGTRIVHDVLFGTFSDVVFRYVIDSVTFNQLGTVMEKNKAAAAWIVKRDIWRHLFARDYHTQYTVAIAEDGRHMKAEQMARLDSISQQPGRTHTYWKRYYEHMVKLRPLNVDDAPSVLHNARTWSPPAPLNDIRVHPFGFRVTTVGGRGILNGFRLLLPTEVAVAREPSVIAYFVPRYSTITDVARWALFTAENPEENIFEANKRVARTANVLQVNMMRQETDVLFHYKVIPFDDTLFGEHVIYNVDRRSCVFYTPDTLASVYFSIVDNGFACKNADGVGLVSSCITCAAPAASNTCARCKTPAYCGQACADEHWEEHRLECE